MPDAISGRLRGAFRDLASSIVLRDIDRLWEGEGFAHGFYDEVGHGAAGDLCDSGGRVLLCGVDHMCRAHLTADFETIVMLVENDDAAGA